MKASRAMASRRSGFTLVELLVVISIIGILIALLLPAVTAAREAARNTQCKNNLKQMGLASQNHLSSWRFFPSGGWGYWWAGDPMRGYGSPQPGGWIYSLLPFMEEKVIWQYGQGINYTTNTALDKGQIEQQVVTPLPTFICPSRRDAILYPYGTTGVEKTPVNFNVPAPPLVAKTDYAANCGDQTTNQSTANPAGGPPSLTAGDTPSQYTWPSPATYTGIVYVRSQVSTNQITDGLSNTFFCGEKFLDTANYTNGTDTGDNEFATCGMDNDNCRTGSAPPKLDYQEPSGTDNAVVFGGPHAAGANMVLCDGSVHTVLYQIDAKTMAAFANKADSQTPNWNNVTQ